MSIGALVVSIAALAWTIYRDLRKEDPDTGPRCRGPHRPCAATRPHSLDPAGRDRLIEVVVDETVRVATTADPD